MLMMALFLRMVMYCHTTLLEEFKKVKFNFCKSTKSKTSPFEFLYVNCLMEIPNFTLPAVPDSNSSDGLVLLITTTISSFSAVILL